MSSSLEKVKSIFRSPGIAAVLRWSKCVHVKVVLVCLITVLATVCSLFFTLATKGLVDGAVSSNSDQLVKYALMLVGIVFIVVEGLLRNRQFTVNSTRYITFKQASGQHISIV